MLPRLLLTILVLGSLPIPTLAQAPIASQCQVPLAAAPQPESAATLPVVAVVTIDPQRRLWLDQQRITLKQLKPLIACFYEEYPQGRTVVMAAKQVPFGDVVEVLEIVRSLGSDRVNLATLGEPTPPIPLELQSPPTLVMPVFQPIQPQGDR